MHSWRAVGAIVAFELRREWFGVLVTALFALYFGAVFTGVVVDRHEIQGDSKRLLDAVMNWIYLFGFPLFGCLMNRTVFHYWRDDPFSRRIAHWRTMPIPLQTIVRARFLQSIAIMIVVGGAFATMQYWLYSGIRELAGPGDWVAETVVWMAYGMTVQTLYILLELGYSGKTYVKWYLTLSVLGLAVSGFIGWRKVSLLLESIGFVKRHPVPIAIAALAVLAAALWAGSRMTIVRMRRRRYIF